MSRRLMLAFTLVTLPVATVFGAMQARGGRGTDQQRAASGAQPRARLASQSGLDLSGLDRTVDPSTDFYQFACRLS